MVDKCFYVGIIFEIIKYDFILWDMSKESYVLFLNILIYLYIYVLFFFILSRMICNWEVLEIWLVIVVSKILVFKVKKCLYFRLMVGWR